MGVGSAYLSKLSLHSPSTIVALLNHDLTSTIDVHTLRSWLGVKPANTQVVPGIVNCHLSIVNSLDGRFCLFLQAGFVILRFEMPPPRQRHDCPFQKCKLIGSGGFDYKDRNGNVCESMDRLFGNCFDLTSISIIECTTVTNVNGMFGGCTSVESGALAQYNWFLNNGVNIVNHAGTFKECGASTETGLAELNQIPFGWGGKLYPASTNMTADRGSTSTYWKITANNPTWTNVKNGMYMFTTESVSRFDGVSMNRSRLYNRINSFSNSNTVNEYYYPAFIQIPGAPGSSTTYQPTWIVTTETYNDMLQAGASNRDMAGTLDFEAYGQFIREYGTYDSNSDVYFVFLVTNTPIENWAGLSGEMAFLFNNNYRNATLRWFFET